MLSRLISLFLSSAKSVLGGGGERGTRSRGERVYAVKFRRPCLSDDLFKYLNKHIHRMMTNDCEVNDELAPRLTSSCLIEISMTSLSC